MHKHEIRASILRRRRLLSPVRQHLLSLRIQQNAFPICASLLNDPIALYIPIHGEVRTSWLFQRCAQMGLRTVIPAVEGCTLGFYPWTIGDELVPVRSTYEPVKRPHQRSLPKTVFVPLIAYDSHGYRIGYGKGYYDRSLATLLRESKELQTIGLAYAFQECLSVPQDKHDIPLNVIINEHTSLT